ncbi:MAG: uL15 family ribosomal protein [Candidatus Liptonbacteria bacterium]|nr:uL15 family ribosomal protein [Candidatus Liptonbacteria bacterium]
MQLHNIGSRNNKPKKRIARGGKRGTYSGRGIKGQKSRAGRRIRPAIRDLILRLPKRRGYSNRPVSEKPFIISLSELSRKVKVFSPNKKIIEVDLNFLKETGILPADYRGKVKILGGNIKETVSIKGVPLSKSAKEKVEKAGGKISA